LGQVNERFGGPEGEPGIAAPCEAYVVHTLLHYRVNIERQKCGCPGRDATAAWLVPGELGPVEQSGGQAPGGALTRGRATGRARADYHYVEARHV